MKSLNNTLLVIVFGTIALGASAAGELILQLTPSNYHGFNISCFGGKDGSIDLTVSQGTPPYYYNWSTDATTEDIDELAVGLYHVTVRDAAGNVGEAYITLTGPEALRIEPYVHVYPNGKNVSCFSCSNGCIILNMTGGAPPFSFIWNDNNPDQVHYSLPGGIAYQALITDANGCDITTQSYVLTEPGREDWTMSGNSGSTSSQYIGTSDNKDLSFRTNSNERMKIAANGDSTNTYLAYSSDGGDSFNNIKVSDTPHVTAHIPGTPNYYAGHYIGLAAYGGKAYSAWEDDRNGTWQIYVSAVTFDAPALYSSGIDIDVNGSVRIVSGSDVHYEAINNLTATVNNTRFDVLSGANTVMVAGNEIVLKDGFTAQSGSDFHAYIDNVTGCTNTYNRVAPSIRNESNSTDLNTYSIYPNPTFGIFKLELPKNDHSAKDIYLCNVLGQPLWQKVNTTESSFSIDITDYPEGLYLVKIVKEGRSSVNKLVHF